MPLWSDKKRHGVVRKIRLKHCSKIEIIRHDEMDFKKYRRGTKDPYFRTFLLNCGMAGRLNLFELQRWFDKNRDYIEKLMKEAEKG